MMKKILLPLVIFTTIDYFLNAVMNCKNTVRVISYDTDVFAKLIYWVWSLQLTARVQLDRWCGAILNFIDSSSLLGTKSIQLLGTHAVSGCNTVSYPFGHGKPMTLKVLKYADHSGLYTAFGEEGATLEQLMETGYNFISSQAKSMTPVRYALYSKRT